MSDAKTILPPTATKLVQALDVLEERLFALPVGAITKDPFAVDAALLDHLAWENSVDVWDSAWPEDVKRQVIALALEVHQYKGTPHAIKLALSAFDVDTELLEWWQPGGAEDGLVAGEFRVTAFAGQPPSSGSAVVLDDTMLAAMRAVVLRVSPVSRRMVFTLGERVETNAYVRSAHRMRGTDTTPLVPASPTVTLATAANVATGLRMRAFDRTRITPVERTT